MKSNTILSVAAVAAAILLIKKQPIAGVGATNTAKALRLIADAGMDIRQDFYTLSFDQLYELPRIMRQVGYRAPSGKYRTGSPGRYFWYYMQRQAGV